MSSVHCSRKQMPFILIFLLIAFSSCTSEYSGFIDKGGEQVNEHTTPNAEESNVRGLRAQGHVVVGRQEVRDFQLFAVIA